MKSESKVTRLLLGLFLVWLLSGVALGQTAIRWDLGAPGSAGAVTTQSAGGASPLFALPGVQLAWCNHPANAVPCTNYATTYTSLTLGVSCPTNAQIVLQGSTSCVATGDNFGNLGVYTTTNTTCTITCYDYTLTVNGISYGPFVWTQGGGSGGGGSLPVATAQGQLLAATGAGTTYAAQNKPAVNVLDIGVDCTGATDSSTVLNTLFGSISHVEVDFPDTCQVRVDHQLTIFGQTAWVLKGMGERPAPGGFGGPTIYGCNGASGSVLYINRSGYGRIDGLGIYPKGPTGVCAASSFTQSVIIDNSGGGGVTGHDIEITHSAFTSSPAGTAIAGYVGLQILGPSNGEMVSIHDSWIHCQNSSNSIGVDNENLTSDNDQVQFNNISSCRYGIKTVGNMRILNNLLTSDGIKSVFGTFGASIYTLGCSSGSMMIAYNEEDSGGPFINNDQTGAASCASGFNVIGNFIGVADISSGEYVIDVGNPGGLYFNLIGNTFLVIQNTSQYILGSASQVANHGPLAYLMDFGNFLRFPTGSNTLGMSSLVVPFQQGESHFATNLVNPSVPSPSSGAGALTEYSTPNHLWIPSNPTGSTFPDQSPWLGLRAFYAAGSLADDWLWQTIANSTQSAMIFNHNAGAATTAWFNWDGQVSGINLAQLSTPAGPSAVTPVGVSGGTTYTYAIVAFGQTGNTAGSSTVSTTTGNAVLSVSNYNQIQLVPSLSIGANKWCVWRTVGGATQGKIGCVNAAATSANALNGLTYYLNDTGLAGDSSSLPASNTTGQIISTVTTGLAPLSVTSTTPVANLTTVPTTYNHTATQQTGAHVVVDSCTLGTNCSVTLTGAAVFTSSSSYQCTATDQTGANAVKFAPSSGSVFVLTGTGVDVLGYICIGN